MPTEKEEEKKKGCPVLQTCVGILPRFPFVLFACFYVLVSPTWSVSLSRNGVSPSISAQGRAVLQCSRIHYTAGSSTAETGLRSFGQSWERSSFAERAKHP